MFSPILLMQLCKLSTLMTVWPLCCLSRAGCFPGFICLAVHKQRTPGQTPIRTKIQQLLLLAVFFFFFIVFCFWCSFCAVIHPKTDEYQSVNDGCHNLPAAVLFPGAASSCSSSISSNLLLSSPAPQWTWFAELLLWSNCDFMKASSLVSLCSVKRLLSAERSLGKLLSRVSHLVF